MNDRYIDDGDDDHSDDDCIKKTTSLQSCTQASFVLVDYPTTEMDTLLNPDP